MTLVIGIVGKPLSGKETSSKLLAERAKKDGNSVGWLQFRDPLQETLEQLGVLKNRNDLKDPSVMRGMMDILQNVWDIPPSEKNVRTFVRLMAAHFGYEGPVVIDRLNLQKLAVVMSPPFGANALSHAVFTRVRKRSEDIVLADGIRWVTDEQELRDLPCTLMLHLHISIEKYLERAPKRRKEGEELKTREQLIAEWNAPNEQYIADIGSRAEATIINESDSLDILRADIDTFYTRYVRPRIVTK